MAGRGGSTCVWGERRIGDQGVLSARTRQRTSQAY